ncbi:MAG: FtsX-like permease family protein [Pirellulaceae bacterium]
MVHFRRTPLAWKNLTHNVRRLMIAVSGVTFAVVLMFMERGFQKALFDSTVELVRNFRADIVLTSSSRYSLSSGSRFSLTALSRASGSDHVREAHPIYLENRLAMLRNPNHSSRPIRVVGCNVRERVFTEEMQPTLDRYRQQLLGPRTALIDVTSKRSIYQIDPWKISATKPAEVELSGKQLRLVGNFHLGTDFANDGTLLMSLENFELYFPQREMAADPLSAVDLGLIVCRVGRDVTQVRDQLQTIVGTGVTVQTRQELIEKEIRFWDTNTPIGVIFRVGMIMGFVVGILICYQVLYNDITDHMPEFATLMAMGYHRGYFINVVIHEACYLALFGFVPGVCISWLLFQLLTGWTGLTMTLSLWDVGLTFVLTVVMCVMSGLLAVRKLLAADPASLF